MKKEDYNKFYIQGSDHYLIPKYVFIELFNEMINWKQDNAKLKKQLEEYKYSYSCSFVDTCKNVKIANYEQQKEFIKYLENRLDICDCFLDTIKSDLQEIPYGVISANENITTRIKENETAHKVYEEILQKYKSIIGDIDDKR